MRRFRGVANRKQQGSRDRLGSWGLQEVGGWGVLPE